MSAGYSEMRRAIRARVMAAVGPDIPVFADPNDDLSRRLPERCVIVHVTFGKETPTARGIEGATYIAYGSVDIQLMLPKATGVGHVDELMDQIGEQFRNAKDGALEYLGMHPGAPGQADETHFRKRFSVHFERHQLL